MQLNMQESWRRTASKFDNQLISTSARYTTRGVILWHPGGFVYPIKFGRQRAQFLSLICIESRKTIGEYDRIYPYFGEFDNTI